MIAIIDTDGDARRALARRIRRFGNEVQVCSRIGEIATWVNGTEPDLVLVDLDLATGDEWTRLGEWKAGGLAAEVVLMASVPPAPGILRRLPDWVSECVPKPVSADRLVWMIRRAGTVARTASLCARWNRGDEQGGWAAIEGVSRSTERWRGAVVRAAEIEAPLLIEGEPGSGRRLSARCIHVQSGRMSQPLVTLDLAGMTRDRVETELLGKGGRMGLFNLARGGTLLLHEVNRLPLSVQAALGGLISPGGSGRGRGGWRVPGVRVLATVAGLGANGEPVAGLHPGLAARFHEDLIRVPPLRERADDILFLVRRLLDAVARREGERAPLLDPGCRVALERYSWPGNVHELRMLAERAMWLGKGLPVLEARHFGLALVPTAGAIRLASASSRTPPGPDPYRGATGAGLFPTLDQLEWQHITAALDQTGGNRTHAARLLGITSRTLRNKLRWARLGQR